MRWLYLALAGAVAVGVLALVNRDGESDPEVGPFATVKSADGSFRRARSPGGPPTFTAAGLGPGRSASGTVTIANTGARRGFFYLTQSRLTDAVGPRGGALSGGLRLTVTDVTSPGAPRRVYSGPLPAMGAEPVGFISPTAARRYRFDAALARGSDPVPLEGSATSVRYVWSALGDSPRRDRRPPVLRVALPPVQRVIERNELLVEARCEETCRLGLTGTVSAGRRAVVPPIRDRRAQARRPVLLAVGIPPAMRAPVRQALLGSRPAALRLQISARDQAGNLSLVRRTVRLLPQR